MTTTTSSLHLVRRDVDKLADRLRGGDAWEACTVKEARDLLDIVRRLTEHVEELEATRVRTWEAR